MKESMAMAYAVKRRSQQKAKGGMIHPSVMKKPSTIVEAIRAKKMAEGGTVDDEDEMPYEMTDELPGDDPDMQMASNEEDEEDPEKKKKMRLQAIMNKVRSKRS